METASTDDGGRVGFLGQLKSLDSRYWIVNAMEMFERLAYYGVRAVVALYIIWPPEKGGLQFTHVQKGAIFAWWAYIQSMLPVFTGGFADRYGHKNTVAVAIAVKIAGYILMATMRDFGGFFLGAMLLAGGTAIFKPGVQGTLAYTLRKSNASIGWGIFYQLVNIGGFAGPILAGYLRGWDWAYVFYSCAIIVAINYLWLPFYKEPTHEEDYKANMKGGKAMALLARVHTKLGSQVWLVVHLAMLIFSVVLFMDEEVDVMMSTMMVLTFGLFAVAFVMLNLLRARYEAGPTDALSVFWLSITGVFQARVWWFIVAFSGFWFMFNQVFDLLPNVIDDWIDTSMVIATLGDAFTGATIPTLLAIFLGVGFGGVCALLVLLAMRPDHRGARDVPNIAYIVVMFGLVGACWAVGANYGTTWAAVGTGAGVAFTGAAFGMRWRSLPLALGTVIVGTIGSTLLIRSELLEAAPALIAAANAGGQVNPEFMINANPGLIMFTMVFFAYLSSFVRPLTSIMVGMLVATIGSYIAGTALVGWACLGGILIFSVGEMLSSPKKMEYLASVAKKGQEALFMGYANMPVAVGWIVGSFVAGGIYEHGGDKISLARRFLVEKLGKVQADVEAIAENDMMATLAAEMNVDVAAAKQTLLETYDPGSVWWIIAAIGFGSIALMIGYTILIRMYDRRQAQQPEAAE